MHKHIISCFCSLMVVYNIFSQKIVTENSNLQNSDANQLTAKERAAINAIAKKHKDGTVSFQAIKKEILGQPGLSSMSIQSAFNVVMMKIEQNAEKDLQYASREAQFAADKKDSLRRKEDQTQKDHADLQKKLQHEYDTLKAASAYSNGRKTNSDPFLNQEKLSEIEAQNAAKRKKNAEAHLQSVKDAIRTSQDVQSQQKR